jgi:glycerophosphoryl diester phosphodiesterase
MGHRGGRALWPENTLYAFERAIACGCDGAELDVQMTYDGQPVVVHDIKLSPALCRRPDGTWLEETGPAIFDMDYESLQAFDVGRADPASDYARHYPHLEPKDGERIPLLREVIAICAAASRPFQLFIEIKLSDDPRLSAPYERITEAVIGLLRELQFMDRAVVISFDHRTLVHAKKIAPECTTWFLTHRQHPPRLGWIAAQGGSGWMAPFNEVSEKRMALARASNLKVGAWTVNSVHDAQNLAQLGVDALFTDDPVKLLGR